MIIPEIVGKPLFFGATAMLIIDDSSFFESKDIRLAYDFMIWVIFYLNFINFNKLDIILFRTLL